MNFDIKDVKSWANRHDAKVGDKGYFIHSIKWFKDDFDVNVDTISCIRDDFGNCFVSEKNFNKCNSFPFFLPLEAVKEDRPKEKKYRAFKNIRELEDALNKDNTSTPQAICVGEDIFIRSKQNHNRVEEMLITSITRNKETKEVLFINTCSPSYLFERYEIRVGNKWLPFGVEIESD